MTFAVFFLDAQERVYARYGGRDSKNADNRQSLEGLRHTMESVLEMHGRETKQFAPKAGDGAPKHIRDYPREGEGAGAGAERGCMHCHQVKEILDRKLVADGLWTRDKTYRYPLPENLGFRLEVNRGNVVESVRDDSPADRVGMEPGDVIQRIGDVPIHSFGDATFALDRAPATGKLAMTVLRGERSMTATLALEEGWRKTDIRWRQSLRRFVPNLPLYGDDLTAPERQALGLSEKQLAFRQKPRVPSRAEQAGFRGGDIILGPSEPPLEMGVNDFLYYIQREFLVGDKIEISILREGKAMKIPVVLGSR